MFGFLEELVEVTNLKHNDSKDLFKVTTLGRNAMCVSNYVKIITYNSQVLSLKLKSGTLNINGELLTIKELNPHDIIISGKINQIDFA